MKVVSALLTLLAIPATTAQNAIEGQSQYDYKTSTTVSNNNNNNNNSHGRILDQKNDDYYQDDEMELELAAEEADDESATEELPIQSNVERFFVHVPKSAGASAYLRFNKIAAKYKCDFTFCNMGTQKLDEMHDKWTMTGNKGKHCQVHMSESKYDEKILRGRSGVYTIVRDPREHVVSQYFHCTEAPVHKHKENMPSLTDWLADWLKGFNEIVENPNGGETRNRVYAERSNYYCYQPINMQSNRTGFDGTYEGAERLGDKFDVIGTTDRFEEALCLIFIHASGGVIPNECDCSSSRRLGLEGVLNSHGVMHHASNFELDDYQKWLIDTLTVIDKRQYDYVKDVLFDKQVEKFEKEYNFKLCENPQPNY